MSPFQISLCEDFFRECFQNAIELGPALVGGADGGGRVAVDGYGGVAVDLQVQGDHSRCSQPPVDTKIEVAF